MELCETLEQSSVLILAEESEAVYQQEMTLCPEKLLFKDETQPKVTRVKVLACNRQNCHSLSQSKSRDSFSPLRTNLLPEIANKGKASSGYHLDASHRITFDIITKLGYRISKSKENLKFGCEGRKIKRSTTYVNSANTTTAIDLPVFKQKSRLERSVLEEKRKCFNKQKSLTKSNIRLKKKPDMSSETELVQGLPLLTRFSNYPIFTRRRKGSPIQVPTFRQTKTVTH